MSIGVRGDLPSLQAALGPSAFDVLPMPTISTPKGTVRPTGGGSVAGASHRGEARQTGAGLPALLLLAARLRRCRENVRIVPAVTSIAADPKAVWATLPNNPSNNVAYTLAAGSVQAIAPQAPGTVYSNSQTNIPNAIEAVLGGTSLQSAMDNLQKQTVADYAAALIPKPAP